MKAQLAAMLCGLVLTSSAQPSDDHVKPGDRIVKIAQGGEAAEAQASASTVGLRLESLEQMALSSNPTLAQAQANIGAAVGLTKQAGLYPNPTIGYYGDEIRGGFLGGGKQGGFVSQTIVTGGKLHAARRVAELEAQQVRTSGEMQRLRVVNAVRTLFYRVLAAQRMVEVKQNLAKLAGDAVRTTYQLGNIGQADRPDILQARVEQQQASVGVKIAEQNVQAAWRMLAAVVGNPSLPLNRMEGDLDAVPELNYEEWLAATLSQSPEVKLAQQGVERAEASLAQARKAPIPDLQLTGILVQSYEPLDTPHRLTGFQAGAQVGVQIPVFNRNQGNIAAAKSEIESARQELARLKLQLEQELANMFREYDEARATVQQYKEEKLLAQQAYTLYQTSYQNMAGAYPQVLISQRTLFQLEADSIQALEKAWDSALSIQSFGLMDGLAPPITPRLLPAK